MVEQNIEGKGSRSVKSIQTMKGGGNKVVIEKIEFLETASSEI